MINIKDKKQLILLKDVDKGCVAYVFFIASFFMDN